MSQGLSRTPCTQCSRPMLVSTKSKPRDQMVCHECRRDIGILPGRKAISQCWDCRREKASTPHLRCRKCAARRRARGEWLGPNTREEI